jgi:hypothetical protein
LYLCFPNFNYLQSKSKNKNKNKNKKNHFTLDKDLALEAHDVFVEQYVSTGKNGP